MKVEACVYTPFDLIYDRIMQTTIYYVLRSRKDGSYLAAQVNADKSSSSDDQSQAMSVGYLMLFREYADGLSYLNAHAPDLAANFAVESVSQSQLKTVMQRWSFEGIGVVEDPWLPKVQFMTH